MSNVVAQNNCGDLVLAAELCLKIMRLSKQFESGLGENAVFVLCIYPYAGVVFLVHTKTSCLLLI